MSSLTNAVTVENPKEFTNKLIREDNKVNGHKINIKSSFYFYILARVRKIFKFYNSNTISKNDKMCTSS